MIRTIRDIVGSGVPSAASIVAPGMADLTREQLIFVIQDVGHALREGGVGRSDVVASVLPAGPDGAVIFLAAAYAAVAAPLDHAMPPNELERWLRDVNPALLVVGPDTASAVRDVAADVGVTIAVAVPSGSAAGDLHVDVPGATSSDDPLAPDPDDVALILHTSGTTARPKRVPILHRNLFASAGNVATTLGLGPGDRCLDVMPLFHIHGLVAGLLASLQAGGSVVCPPPFNGADIYGWIEGTDPTWMTAVPTMYQAMLDRASDHRQTIESCDMRLLRSSSSALPAPVHESLERVFSAPVIEAYGMTEAAHQIASNDPRHRVAGAVGRAAGPEVAILGEDDSPVPAGVEGRLVIRGENVIEGYADPKATAEAFIDGWFLTGDIGVVDDDGILRLTGRDKKMINRGGETIAPAEIDAVILAHPDVARAMTFSVPDHRLGEQVGALVVPVAGSDPDEASLRRFVADHLAPAKVPRRVVFADDVPRGPTGKPRRIGIADELGLKDLDGPPVTPSEARASLVGSRGGRTRYLGRRAGSV